MQRELILNNVEKVMVKAQVPTIARRQKSVVCSKETSL